MKESRDGFSIEVTHKDGSKSFCRRTWNQFFFVADAKHAEECRLNEYSHIKKRSRVVPVTLTIEEKE